MNMTLATARTESRLIAAAEHNSTPFYYYSRCTLRQQVQRLRACFSNYPVRLLFATMANDRQEVLRTIASLGVGACVNSLPHLRLAQECGFALEDVQFTSSGTPLSDMKVLRTLGVAVNLDSPSQIAQWCDLAPGARVGARLNAANLCGERIPRDRMGTDRIGFESAVTAARERSGGVIGMHIYAGTNYQRADEILSVLGSVFEFARCYSEIEYINLGGGIGVDYSRNGPDFEYQAFGEGVCSLAHDLAIRRGRPLTILCEPGRSMVAGSGTLVTRVTDVKYLHDEVFATVDASVAVFPRPFHYPDTPHHVRRLEVRDCDERVRHTTIVGRTTFSRDILGRALLAADLKVGDILAFDDAGAYCESMASRFLGQPQPSAVVDDD